MPVNQQAYHLIKNELEARGVTIVAVSKTKPVEDILELYQSGHRDFGENYVQELVEKQKLLPTDIRWHFIGHLQSNKVKQIAPFVHLIHGVDSTRLLNEINRQALRHNRKIDLLLQVHIAEEETKFGLSELEILPLLQEVVSSSPQGIRISGLMGMASFTSDSAKVRNEFHVLKGLYEKLKQAFSPSPQIDLHILSMGMSADYKEAVKEGSNLVRIGSLLFGSRTQAG